MSALNDVLAAIAHSVLGAGHRTPSTIGAITLRPHQLEALGRVRESIERVGGALLADEPGLGKTFVALALAREFPRTVVAAPAVLRQLWLEAAAATRVDLSFVSLETLSRRHATGAPPRGGLVIVDEAHHVCNPAAARYARLARLASDSRVLLLTATPVRNRRAELGAMLALFMGPRAHALDEGALAGCIVRRAGDPSLLPVIDGPRWHRVRALARVRESIAGLPPPLPALDGTEAAALLTMTLARCWASSLAALDAALRRRLQRGAALGAVLDEGRIPTRSELRAWVLGEDAMQLAFPSFAAHAAAGATDMRPVLNAHLEAVRALRSLIRGHVEDDTRARAELLLAVRHAHPGARIVAFTSHAATAEALFRSLARERGIALLTSRGARTAGGSRPRSDVIGALGAPRAPGVPDAAGAARAPGAAASRLRDDISLVLATDLLSEGVNLQGASVVVHLDVPWTPAGLDQRVGRAARMGSAHARVFVHGIAPPAAAERLLALDRRLARKHRERVAAANSSQQLEELRAVVHGWCDGTHSLAYGAVRQDVRSDVSAPKDLELDTSALAVASVRAARAGFLAVVELNGARQLVCGSTRGGRPKPGWRISDAPGDLLATARAVHVGSMETDIPDEPSPLPALARWLASRAARVSSGSLVRPSAARRRLLARLDTLALGAGARARAAVAGRLARVRELIAGSVSAGAEATILELSRGPAEDLESLVGACESLLPDGAAHGTPGPIEPHPSERSAVRALLLLRHAP